MGSFNEIMKLFVKKFTSRKLWFAFAAIAWAYISGNYDMMSTIILGYLAVQAVDDAVGEIRGLTGDLNFWVDKLMSRKFWISALGVFLAYHIQNFEIMRNVVVAYLSAEGFSDALPLVKDVDFGSIFKRKAVAAVVPALSLSASGTISAKPGEFGYIPPTRESDNYLEPAAEQKPAFEFIPFNDDEWSLALKERARSQFDAEDIWLQILALPALAEERAVRFTRNVVSFGAFYLEKAREAFKSKFGFAYEDRGNPESLAKLKDLCGKVPSSFLTFIATTSQDQSYQTIYETVKSVADQFAEVDRAMEKETSYDARLQQYTPYTYNQAFWRIGEFKVD